ncbi:MAG: sigma-70 family RNA polymerase sigma factor [Acidimicrobiia bacterium]|jgi:RNA polymerase sigma-70 factor, ECF subfamily
MSGHVLSGIGDAELVRLVGESRQDALAEAYRRHASPVLSLAARLTRNQALAEEVVQEVFVRLWQRPAAFDPERGSLRTFLLSHTHGRSVDLIRSESSRRTREDNESRLVAEAGPSLEEEVVEMRMAEHVRKALADLHPSERRAIELAYFGGHSYREVAELLSEPEGTVKSRIRSGLKRLKGSLTADGIIAT